MAAGSLSPMPAAWPFMSDVPQSTKGKGSKYLAQVSEFVSTYRHQRHTLKNPAGSIFAVGQLVDTVYRDEPAVVNGWGKFYLPDMVDMHVIGTVQDASCQSEHIVLMTCEDTQVYAFDGCELHLVAESLEQLLQEGLKYPGSTSYEKGEAFKDMADSEWAEIRKGAVGKKLDQQHEKLVQENKARILKNLKSCNRT